MLYLLTRFLQSPPKPFAPLPLPPQSNGFKTALLTNNWKKSNGESLQPMESSLFDVVVESCKEGVRKPNPAIFQLCLERLELSPDQCLFLGHLIIIFFSFLDASSHLYDRLCPMVGRLVGWSVTHSLKTSKSSNKSSIH